MSSLMILLEMVVINRAFSFSSGREENKTSIKVH